MAKTDEIKKTKKQKIQLLRKFMISSNLYI